jgi:hypothetical protein
MKPLTQFSEAIENNFQPVFLSGSPRSGTTVCHALICTSNDVNDYVPESSYVTGMLNNFISGNNNEGHNLNLFGSMQDFQMLGIEQISFLLIHLWLRLGKKKYLCLKDPLMYRHFDWLDQAFKKVKYIFTFRDPIETISSRVTVLKKEGKNLNSDVLAHLSNELFAYYQYAQKLVSTKPDRALLINYQDIIDGVAEEHLASFLNLNDIDRKNLWKSEFVSQHTNPVTEWSTPKYFKPISDNKTELVLTLEETNFVNDNLREVYNSLSIGKRFG